MQRPPRRGPTKHRERGVTEPRAIARRSLGAPGFGCPHSPQGDLARSRGASTRPTAEGRWLGGSAPSCRAPARGDFSPAPALIAVAASREPPGVSLRQSVLGQMTVIKHGLPRHRRSGVCDSYSDPRPCDRREVQPKPAWVSVRSSQTPRFVGSATRRVEPCHFGGCAEKKLLRVTGVISDASVRTPFCLDRVP